MIDRFAFHFVQQISYEKTRNDSYIRVNNNAVFRGHYNDPGECKRFYVTFNGEECTDPEPIDWVTFSDQAGDMIRSATSM